jgi:hypothetical protein
MFICSIAYSAVHVINLSSVKTSYFIQFTKPREVLTYNISIENCENYFFNIYIGTHVCGCMFLYFSVNMDSNKTLNNKIPCEVIKHKEC